jgi:PAS domain S-box-containing protein
MHRISLSMWLSLGVSALTMSVLCTAQLVGLLPDQSRATREARSTLCASVATQCAATPPEGIDALRTSLSAMAKHREDIVQVELVDANGLSIVTSPIKPETQSSEGASTTEGRHVPLVLADGRTATLKMTFRDESPTGLPMLRDPAVRLIAFAIAAGFLANLMFFRRNLRRLEHGLTRLVPHHVNDTLDALAEGVLVLDCDDAIAAANAAFAQISGESAEALRGRNVDTLAWRWLDAPNCNSSAWRLARGQGQACLAAGVILTNATGDERRLSVNVKPLFDGKDHYRGALVSCADITDVESQNTRLRELVSRLKRSKRSVKRQSKIIAQHRREAEVANEAKSRFLANMSHEIRTPMTAILGYADVLADVLVDDEAMRAAATIKRNGQHLLDLINGILDLSKIEAGKMEVDLAPCAPKRVIDEVAALMQVRANSKGIMLVAECDASVPTSIVSDETRIRQILLNLVGNAIKFTAAGEVRIFARVVAASSAEAVFEIGVRDTGVGMSDQQMPKLFQPFQQADNSVSRRFGGTGLGLAISSRLAEMLGGSIRAQSKLGVGSTFTLSLPLADYKPAKLPPVGPEPQSSSPVIPAAPPQPLLGLCILLAEDGPDNQRLIAHLLRKAGAEVLLAADGQQAIDQLRAAEHASSGDDQPHDAESRWREVDVVLMDMQMPVVDGYSATRYLRAQGYRGVIAALTAHAMSADREKCLEAGCDDYFTKPVDRVRLIEFVARLAERRTATDVMHVPG